jgi:hypothetical protein
MMHVIVFFAILFLLGMIAVGIHDKTTKKKEAVKGKEENKETEKPSIAIEQLDEPILDLKTFEDQEDECDDDDEFAGMTYDEKMKVLAKRCEDLLFETVSSLELSRTQKEELIPQILMSVEQHEDETKILKTVVRKLYKTLITKTPDFMKRVEYEERFDEEKEEMRSGDYVVIDSQWDQFVDDFEELKADIVELMTEPEPQSQRIYGISTVEKRTDEVDGQLCEVVNFAVKGLFFRSKEDQEAACTLKTGDSLYMEPEPENEKDPNALKVTMKDGHHIGYVDSKCSGYVKENLSRILKFVVSKIDDYNDPPYIYAEAFLKKD